MNKEIQLKNAVNKFNNIETPTAQDYMNLFIVVNRCLKQGDGLLWSQVKEILENVLDETDYSFVNLGE